MKKAYESLLQEAVDSHMRLWEAVESVSVIESGLEVLVRNSGGIAILPRRIFRNPEELQEWHDYAQKRIALK